MRTIYFDHAATSYPKPVEVVNAVVNCLTNVGGNPGRSGHRLSIDAGRLVFAAREEVSGFFRVSDSSRIVFAANATEAINLALFGILREGSRVLVSSFEHNAVMRPLRYLEKERKLKIDLIRSLDSGIIDMEHLQGLLNQDVKLIIINHASNVTGVIQPLESIKAMKGNARLLVDGAQTAGSIPVYPEEIGIDLFAFTGHKSLLGPTGTGGLYISTGVEKELMPFKYGGTGSTSGLEEMPDILPDKYESGTLNIVSIAGLGEGIRFINNIGIDKIREREHSLTEYLLKGLSQIKGVKIYKPHNADGRTAVLSINILDISPSDIALTLDRKFGIMTRPGLQCAPAAHKTIGTYPEGTLRISLGYTNNEKELDILFEAIEYIVKKGAQV